MLLNVISFCLNGVFSFLTWTFSKSIFNFVILQMHIVSTHLYFHLFFLISFHSFHYFWNGVFSFMTWPYNKKKIFYFKILQIHIVPSHLYIHINHVHGQKILSSFIVDLIQNRVLFPILKMPPIPINFVFIIILNIYYFLWVF